jgi:hypothetical protein
MVNVVGHAMRSEQLPSSSADTPAPPDVQHGRYRTLLHYSPAMVLLAAVLIDQYRLADPDLWGHIYFGRMRQLGPRDPTS